MMNNCPRVLLVGLIASSLLPNGKSFPFEGFQVGDGYYDVKKDFHPGVGGDWNTRKAWGVVPYKGEDGKGWGPDVPYKGVEGKDWGPNVPYEGVGGGPDYGRSEDWVSKRAWEEQEKIGHGGLLAGVEVVLPGHEMKGKDWGPDVPYRGAEGKGWGPDYGRSEDWVSKRAWEDQGKIGHGGLVAGVEVVLPGHEMKRGEWDRKDWDRGDWDQKDWDRKYLDRKDLDRKEWDRKELNRGDWDQKGWDRKEWDGKEWDGKEWDRKDLVKGDWDRKDWDQKDQWKRPPLEHLKKVPGFGMLKDTMKHGKEGLVSFLS